MGWRGTIALAIVLLVVATYAYIDVVASAGKLDIKTILEPAPPTPPAEAVRPIFTFHRDDIVGIVIRRGEQEIRLQRSGAVWTGVTPPDAADEFLDDLLGQSEILALDVPANELADHGLDPPRLTITLERRDGAPVSLRIGSHNPPATGVYVQTSEKPAVILTGALLLWDVEKIEKAAQPAAAG